MSEILFHLNCLLIKALLKGSKETKSFQIMINFVLFQALVVQMPLYFSFREKATTDNIIMNENKNEVIEFFAWLNDELNRFRFIRYYWGQIAVESKISFEIPYLYQDKQQYVPAIIEFLSTSQEKYNIAIFPEIGYSEYEPIFQNITSAKAGIHYISHTLVLIPNSLSTSIDHLIGYDTIRKLYSSQEIYISSQRGILTAINYYEDLAESFIPTVGDHETSICQWTIDRHKMRWVIIFRLNYFDSSIGKRVLENLQLNGKFSFDPSKAANFHYYFNAFKIKITDKELIQLQTNDSGQIWGDVTSNNLCKIRVGFRPHDAIPSPFIISVSYDGLIYSNFDADTKSGTY